jgi:hypothetical protein
MDLRLKKKSLSIRRKKQHFTNLNIWSSIIIIHRWLHKHTSYKVIAINFAFHTKLSMIFMMDPIHSLFLIPSIFSQMTENRGSQAMDVDEKTRSISRCAHRFIWTKIYRIPITTRNIILYSIFTSHVNWWRRRAFDEIPYTCCL